MQLTISLYYQIIYLDF